MDTVKFSASQMIWGSISSKGIGRLHFLNGTLKADGYIDILRTRLLPYIQEQFGGVRNCVFQDDSAPCHRAKKVRCLPHLI